MIPIPIEDLDLQIGVFKPDRPAHRGQPFAEELWPGVFEAGNDPSPVRLRPPENRKKQVGQRLQVIASETEREIPKNEILDPVRISFYSYAVAGRTVSERRPNSAAEYPDKEQAARQK